MRKDVSGLVTTLEKSISEITASATDNRDELLAKSFQEFKTTLLGKLEPVLPVEREETLPDELNHISMFAGTLSNTARGIELIKQDPAVTEHMLDQLDRFLGVGELVLRGMANGSAEISENPDADERAGLLVKIEGYDNDLLIKTDLPEDLRVYLTDPLETMAELVLTSRSFVDDAIALAEPMAKMNMIPQDFADEFPELFEVVEPVEKAFPPAKKQPPQAAPGQPAPRQATAPQAAPPAEDPEQTGMEDEPDPGDAAGDDATQNPIELMVRMASIIVVVGGSILQSQGGDMTSPDQSAMPPSSPNSQFAKGMPIADVPLAKILSGEVEVDPTVADALEEREMLRKSLNTVQAEQETTRLALAKLQEVVDRFNATPAQPKGAIFQVEKRGDYATLPAALNVEQETQRLAELAKISPEAAAKEMLKIVHAGGGQPLVPPR